MAAVRLLCHMMGWTHPEPEESQTNAEHSELAEMIRRVRAGEAKKVP